MRVRPAPRSPARRRPAIHPAWTAIAKRARAGQRRKAIAGRCAACVLLPFLFLFLFATGATATEPRPEHAATSDASAATGTGEEAFDPCDWSLEEEEEWQEKSRDVYRGMACHTYRWFDGLFGDTHDFDESQLSGWLRTGAQYSRYEGFEPRLRLRVRGPLPNMSERWDVMLGRENEDEVVTDRRAQDETFYNPGIRPAEDSEWLLGLGHRRRQDDRGFDYSVGVRLRTPPRPYVKAQYFYGTALGRSADLRFRQTAFWRSEEGFGTTSRGDLAYNLSATDVVRWESVGTVSEEREGLDWYFGQTWYHLFDNESALSLLTFVRGETGAEVPLQEYGFNLVWRRPFTRDWLYLSVGPSLTWPRYHLDEERKASPGFGVWLEMEFGEYRY